jgi:hypothetical protein
VRVRRRRRYEVVVEGLSGQAAAQRSVVSDHRTEADAREVARVQRARLQVIYGEGAGAWRVVVMRDDELVVEEHPAQPPPPPPPRAEPPRPAPEPASSGPVPDWVIERVEQSIARKADRDRGDAGGG